MQRQSFIKTVQASVIACVAVCHTARFTALFLVVLFLTMFLFLLPASGLAFERQKSTRCGHFLATSYTVDEGLPTNLVKDILQDKRGFVWLATDAGLVRFDGFRFVTIQHNLPSLYVKRLLLRKNGKLLALTDLGLVELTSQMDSVIVTPVLAGTQTEQPNTLHYAKSMYEDASGNLWFGEKQAVVRWRNGSLKRYQFPEKCNSTNVVLTFAFADDAAGNLIVTSFQGFCFRYNQATDSFDEITLPQNYGTFSACVAIRQNEFVISTEKGLLRLTLQFSSQANNQIPLVSYKELVSGVNKISSLFLSQSAQRTGAALRSPRLFIGTWYEGILTSDTSLANPEFIKNLKPQRIKNFYEDRFGNVWVCGDQGIVFLEQAMMRYVDGFDKVSPDVGNTVQAANGMIYTISGENLYEIDPEQVSSKLVWSKPASSGVLYALHADKQGGVWVGSLSGLLVYWKNGVVQRTLQTSTGSSERGIFSLTEDREGRLWGCMYYDKLSMFCLELNGTMKYFGPEQGLTTIAQVVKCSDDGTLYVGTSGNPQEYLYRYNATNNRFENISIPLTQSINFKVNIYDIAFDPKKPRTLWLASSGGLMMLENESITQPFSKNPELSNVVGKAVVVQKNGTVWMGTDNGVMRYNPDFTSSSEDASQSAAFLQQPAGLISRTITFRSLLFDNQGKLWTATTNGLFALNLQNLASETQTPSLVQAMVNGVRMSFSALPKSFSSESYVQLFFSVFTPSPHITSFRSRMYLEGSTKTEWSRPSQESVLSLSNLESGTYILEVAARRDGVGEVWSKPLTLRFAVKPVWYRSWWAFVLYALGATSLLGFVILAIITGRERNRIALEQQARLRLQEMVQHRTREITQQKELLEAQTLEIQSANAELLHANDELIKTNAALKEANSFKTRMISIVSHDLKNPLGSMLGLAKMLESDIENQEQRSMAHDMGELASQMLGLVKDLLDSAAIETGKIDIEKSYIDIGEIITAIVWQYRSIAEKKEQSISLAVEASCLVDGDQRRLRQVFENLISNAVKYSPIGKTIWVTVENCPKTSSIASSAQSCVRISIRDEGPGFTEDDKRKAFGHFQKLSAKPTGGESSSGVGLAIVKQITELHGGRVWIESIVGNGATFVVELPALPAEFA
jgi:signal transduction histidine kinase/ligand-binding sensor domain-containing protein